LEIGTTRPFKKSKKKNTVVVVVAVVVAVVVEYSGLWHAAEDQSPK